MARKYLRVTEVIKICGVEEAFLDSLEKASMVRPIIRQRRKLYAMDQVDRVRVAHVLIEELGVNLAGAEVALHMRSQIMAMQRQFKTLVRRLEEGGNPIERKAIARRHARDDGAAPGRKTRRD
jgi:DNA-binding transcriptional MerR regulator